MTFKIPTPFIVSFSGGRTSAYMLYRIVQAYGGVMPKDSLVLFANTGKEMPQTLDFVRDCQERWGVAITWLEFATKPSKRAKKTGKTHSHKVVDHATASRKGNPFAEYIAHTNYLPNPSMRSCTQFLKIVPINKYAAAHFGTKDFTSVIGIRADEPRRVAKINSRETDTDLMPLATAGITLADITAFWDKQNWGLELPIISGASVAGNCDLCFLKGKKKIAKLIAAKPELADWWIEQEGKINATFRPEYSYTHVREIALSNKQIEMFDNELGDCFCGD